MQSMLSAGCHEHPWDALSSRALLLTKGGPFQPFCPYRLHGEARRGGQGNGMVSVSLLRGIAQLGW